MYLTRTTYTAADCLKALAWGLVLVASPLREPLSTVVGQETVERVAAEDRPRVLLIGDSISIGYTPAVIEMLEGTAVVTHHPGNAQHTGTGLKRLDDWLGEQRWDVIHFNWGLWDLCYRHADSKVSGKRDKVNGTLTTSTRQYEENLRELVWRLKQTNAQLVWASTTPVPAGEPGRYQGSARDYNSIAARIMEENDVPINDLYLVASELAAGLQKPKDVHFTSKGSRVLAKGVADSIRVRLRNLGQ